MEHYAGIDVSLESVSICVVDASGRIIREAKVASEPEAQPSPHFVSAILGVNRPVFETASAKRSMSGASLCSGMLGINS
jgi:predicted NBD/HSP70 family sugar kinase